MKSYINKGNKTGILGWVQSHPLLTVLLAAGVFRLLAVVFAKGYMATDDHFRVIEVADGWLHGSNEWYPDKPPMRGILYPYSVTAIMWLLSKLSVTLPELQMFFIRIIHALWSMVTVVMIYKVVKKEGSERTALIAGLMGALFFANPFMSVRNLAEFVCQPVILGGLILVDSALKRDEGRTSRLLLFSGLLLGLCFMLRYQNSVIPIAVFIYLLVKKQWKPALIFAFGVVIMLGVEIAVDLASYSGLQFPFINLMKYQSVNVHSYVTNPVYTHLGTILLAFIPPFSFIFAWWIIRGRVKMPVMFWGMVGFLLIHSLIPQKQERFILPILPELIILGVIGSIGSAAAGKKWMKWLWGWFWCLNSALLIIATFNYSQKARVESLIELSEEANLGKVVVINTEHPMNPPKYYLNRKGEIHTVHQWSQLQPLADSLKSQVESGYDKSIYIIVYTHKPLEYYKEKIEEQFDSLKLAHHIRPSLVDALLHYMNPKHNHSKEAYIYRWR